jgi:hypothetical protein
MAGCKRTLHYDNCPHMETVSTMGPYMAASSIFRLNAIMLSADAEPLRHGLDMAASSIFRLNAIMPSADAEPLRHGLDMAILTEWHIRPKNLFTTLFAFSRHFICFSKCVYRKEQR